MHTKDKMQINSKCNYAHNNTATSHMCININKTKLLINIPSSPRFPSLAKSKCKYNNPQLTFLMSSQFLMGSTTGPTFSSMSNSTPIPGSGVRMSLNRMHPSVL